MQNHLLIFGYGYTASNLARSLNPNKWNICGTSRSKTNDEYCDIINYEKFKIEKALNTSTHILLSIPPTDQGDIVFQDFRNLIEKHSNIKWIGYLSTTAVYGNHNGAWVNEKTNTNPSNQQGKFRALAENQWLQFGKENNIAVNIFRLAAIYGPNRNALLQVKTGKARFINKKDQVFSRIHVADIAEIIKTAMEKAFKNEIFNLADNYPCSTMEVNNYAANLLKLPEPEIIDYEKADLSEMAKKFYQDNKRVSNNKIKEMLNITLKFPTYREGLDQIFADEYNQLN